MITEWLLQHSHVQNRTESFADCPKFQKKVQKNLKHVVSFELSHELELTQRMNII